MGDTRLPEQISRIAFNAMPPQNGTKFLFEQEMDVAFSSANGQHIYVVVFRNARETRPQARLQFLVDDFEAAFGGKDRVDVVFRVGKCVAPSALYHAQEPMVEG